jgi:hypothetical protein
MLRIMRINFVNNFETNFMVLRLEIERPNIERPNIERPNIKRPNVEFYNVKRLNVEQLNVDYDWRSKSRQPNRTLI